MDKEVKEIIEDVFGDLTSDYDSNLELLEMKKEKYKSHPRYASLLDKILIKEKTYLDNKSKEAFKEMVSKYTDSIEYGISLANEYFEKGKIEDAKKALEITIKSFSKSYINDEFGNVIYFTNEEEKEIFSKINKDEREVIECPVNKAYVYFMYGRILLEENKTNEALLSFDLAKTYNPFLKEAYFFKVLLLKVNKKFDEAKEELLKAHKYIYKHEDLGDFYYFVGNYCYKFINKEYEFVMYKKSYSLNPVKELYEELNEIKPSDLDLDYDENEFESIAIKENIPTSYNEELMEYINKD